MATTLRSLTVLAVLGFAASVPGSSPGAVVHHYVEDFTTTEYRDALATTACWDTVAAELRLLPFGISSSGFVGAAAEIRSLAVRGTLCAAAADSGGLQLFDVTDPESPSLHATLPLPGRALGVAIAGDYAYVCADTAGVQVVDISSPASPSIAGSYDTPGEARDIAVTADLAFIADGSAGLFVLDITDPTAPAAAGSLVTRGETVALAHAGRHLFLAEADSGLDIVEVSVPTAPALAGSLVTAYPLLDLADQGDVLYAAAGASGLAVIDISEKTAPSVTTTYSVAGSALAVDATRDFAYLAAGAAGVFVVDVADPSFPSLFDSFSAADDVLTLALSGTAAYLGESATFEILRVAARSNMWQAGSVIYSALRTRVATNGRFAYVVSSNLDQLDVYDVSDPASPALLGSSGFESNPYDVVVSGDRAYFTNVNTMRVYDVADPTTPTMTGSVGLNTPKNLVVDGLRAFAVSGQNVVVIDASDSANPLDIGYAAVGYSAYDVAVDGDRGVAAVAQNLKTLDLSDPTSPTQPGAVALSVSFSCNGVHLVGATAYVAAHEFFTVDVSDLSNPVILDSVLVSGIGCSDAVTDGDVAYVVDLTNSTSSTLYAVDVRDPADLVVLDTLAMSVGQFNGLALSGDHALLGANNGLHVCEVKSRSYESGDNVAQSLAIDTSDSTVTRLLLHAACVGSVHFAVTADGGGTWEEMPADSTWRRLAAPGNDLRWHTTHNATYRGPNPACTDVGIDWLYEFGVIDAVADVPQDQGGWVDVQFTRSARDFTGESPQATSYYLWQRTDAAAVSRGRGEAGKLREAAVVDRPDGWPHLLDAAGARAAGFPPGSWVVVGSAPAMQQDEYAVRVPTAADSSSAGANYTVFLVTAHTVEPSTWFMSPPDSGYSIDNIAPSIPTGLQLAGTSLEWDECPDEDFQYFTVWGSETGDFGDAVWIAYVVTPSLDVGSTPYAWYHVTATDDAGNQGQDAAVENTAVAARSTRFRPTAYDLQPARPNPFATGTTIVFDVPLSGRAVVEIFDVAGRSVRTLVDRAVEPGRYAPVWDGRDAAGRHASPGVYFVRFTAGDFRATRKVVLRQ